MPQLRSIALFALFFFLEVSYPRVAAAASPQSSPHVAASNEPVITKATPAPAKPVPPPKPPCSAGPIELHLLAPGDSQGLANLLNTIFTDVKIEPGMKAGNKASGANAAGAENSSAPTPDGTLCVKNGATGKYLKPSDPKLDPQGRAAAVQKVVRQLDTEAFKGNKLNSISSSICLIRTPLIQIHLSAISRHISRTLLPIFTSSPRPVTTFSSSLCPEQPSKPPRLEKICPRKPAW